jgi:ELWxxDGT repeat protein
MKKSILSQILVCLPFFLSGQTPQLLQDLHRPVAHDFFSTSSYFFNAHNKVIFDGSSTISEYGVWEFEQDAATLISGFPSGYSNLVEAADGFFAVAGYGNMKYWLVKHDGNPAVSRIVADLNTNFQIGVPEIVVLNDKAYYSNSEQGTGFELWCASGIADSDYLIKDCTPGAGSTFPVDLTKADNMIYFRGGAQGQQLWCTDGTSSGTVQLFNFAQINFNIQAGSLKTIGDQLFFLVNKTSGETEFWISNGTVNGTIKVLDVQAVSSSYFQSFILNGKYIYLAKGVPYYGDEWITTDGTSGGTEVLFDLSGPENSYFREGNCARTVLNGEFFFFYLQASGALDLYKSNGTTTGTQKLKTLNASTVRILASTKQLFFFLLLKQNDDVELWSSDGTDVGTELIKKIGNASHLPSFYGYAATDSSILFRISLDEPEVKALPLYSNGTPQGTYIIKGVPAPYLEGSSPKGFIQGANGAVFFVGQGENDLTCVWGTEGQIAIEVTQLDTFGGFIYGQFGSPLTTSSGKALWFSDKNTLNVFDEAGTLSQIKIPADIYDFWSNGPGGDVYFTTNNPRGIWRSDGTENGTFEVIATPPNSVFYGLKMVGDSLFFMQGLTQSGEKDYLWITGGTASTTLPLGPLESGSTFRFADIDGHLSYLSQINPDSTNLYVSGYPTLNFGRFLDSYFAGVAIADSQLFVLSSRIHSTVDDYYFSLWVEENGQPVLLRNFKSVAGYKAFSSGPQYLLNTLKDKVVFGAGLTTDNAELWISDGTTGGTYEFRDLNPNGSSNPNNFIRYNEQLWLFTANDGIEVAWWATDGTWSGTFKVASLASLKDYFIPTVENAYLTGDQLYFSMNDGITGNEPWVMVLEDSLVLSTITPLLQTNDLNVWPNPAKDCVNLTLKNQCCILAQLEIFNNAGQVVFKQKMMLPEKGPLTIRFTQPLTGIHFLKVTSENGKTWIKKLLFSE